MTSTATIAPQVPMTSTSTDMPHGAKNLLPEDFTPGPFDFIIGRGKQVKQSAGNVYMCDCIHSIADEYTSGDKATKSNLLSRLVTHIFDKGNFVKKDVTTGRWFAVEDALARTSAAQAVRDCLHSNYKSSRQFKQQRRRKNAKSTSAQKINKNEVTLGEEMPPMMSVSVPASLSIPSMPKPRSVSMTGEMPTQQPCQWQQPGMNMNWQAQSTKTVEATPQGEDVFSILASAFLPGAAQEVNPFEPVPIGSQSVVSDLDHEEVPFQGQEDILGDILHGFNVSSMGLDDLDMTLQQNAANIISTDFEPVVSGTFF